MWPWCSKELMKRYYQICTCKHQVLPTTNLLINRLTKNRRNSRLKQQNSNVPLLLILSQQSIQTNLMLIKYDRFHETIANISNFVHVCSCVCTCEYTCTYVDVCTVDSGHCGRRCSRLSNYFAAKLVDLRLVHEDQQMQKISLLVIRRLTKEEKWLVNQQKLTIAHLWIFPQYILQVLSETLPGLFRSNLRSYPCTPGPINALFWYSRSK